MANRPNFRARILARLEELGRKRLWLASQIDGIKQANLYSYLKGDSDLRVQHLEEIAAILGMDLLPSDAIKPIKKKLPEPPKMPV